MPLKDLQKSVPAEEGERIVSQFTAQQPNPFAVALQKLKEGPEISLVQGINNVRVVSRFKPSETPLTPDSPREALFWLEVHLHWKVGPEGRRRVVRCLKAEDRKPCYVCEYIKQLQARGHKQPAEEMAAAPRYLASGVAVDFPDAVPKVLNAGSQVLEGILILCNNPAWGDCSDPVNGYVLSIMKSGEGMNTRYTVQGTPSRVPIKPEWLEELPDLDAHYTKYSYQQQQAIVAGLDPNQAGNGDTPPPAAAFAAPPHGPAAATPPAGPPLPSVPSITPPPPPPGIGAPPPRVGSVVSPGIAPPPVSAATVSAPITDTHATTTITGGEGPREEEESTEDDFQRPDA